MIVDKKFLISFANTSQDVFVPKQERKYLVNDLMSEKTERKILAIATNIFFSLSSTSQRIHSQSR
jgi:hypothetical protein